VAVTIHDLTIHRFSTARATTRWRPFNLLKRLLYRIVFWLAIKRAKVVFVPTEFVKKDLLKEYTWLLEKRIIVTYEGVDETFCLPKLDVKETHPSGKDESFLSTKYKVQKPYLLYVGSMYPHKNLERLIEAFSLVAEEYENLKLVLVGKRDFFQRRLRGEVVAVGKTRPSKKDGSFLSRIIFPAFKVKSGYVPDEDLAVFYKNALAFVFPSLSEGFGLPPLEAMQFGVPVVASKATCIPEVCGAAALYFDPEDVEDIAAKIKSLVKNESLREDLVTRGFKNLERFSWQEMALRTLKGYRMLN
ncbi:MAG: glycosyltransferase family 1 protein, partial [Patescibacteria group bacterium]|nr:glycosyltransferase family 1 protein [Patescibacteria group bacterium]